MTSDIHSIQFYEIIAKSIADRNKNGKIDTDSEQSIFTQYMNSFDMDGDNKVDESDIEAYKQTVSYSQKDRETLKAIEDFEKKHSAGSLLSWAESDEYAKLVSCDILDKKTSIHAFKILVRDALEYLKKQGQEEQAEQYSKSFEKFCDENKE